MRFRLYHGAPEGPYGIRTRAAAVRGRCPRPLDEWAVANAECSGLLASGRVGGSSPSGLRRSRTGWGERRLGVTAVDPLLESPPDLLAGRRGGRSARGGVEAERCGPTRRGRRGSAHRRLPRREASGGQASARRARSIYYQRSRAVGTRPAARVPHFAHVSCDGLSTTACTTTGSSRDPSARSSGTPPGPARARTRRGRRAGARSSPSGRDRGTGRSGRSAVAGLAAGDPESLAAVGAEHVADRPLGRALERGEQPLAVGLRLPARECGARTCSLRLARRERALGDPEPDVGLLLEAGVGEEPAVRVEEADHRGRLLHGLHVAGEVGADVGGRAGPRRGRCDNENEGAQARDKGFQERTSASGTWPTARAAVGLNAESPALAVRVRSCEATGAHKDRRDRLPNLHRRCHKRFRLEQRETPLAGRFGGCGTGTRTPTSGARIRRPTIRRSRRASGGL